MSTKMGNIFQLSGLDVSMSGVFIKYKPANTEIITTAIAPIINLTSKKLMAFKKLGTKSGNSISPSSSNNLKNTWYMATAIKVSTS